MSICTSISISQYTGLVNAVKDFWSQDELEEHIEAADAIKTLVTL